MSQPIRVQILVARAGFASRRGAEQLIQAGRVRINGHVAQLGDKADPERDHVDVLGQGVVKSQPPLILLFHKPRGVVCTVHDPEGRPTVLDSLREKWPKGRVLPRLYPIGRLDYDAEGLLLLTNDGMLCHRLSHPKHHVPRTYLAKVKGCPTPEMLASFEKGLYLPPAKPNDGKPRERALPATAVLVRQQDHMSWIKIEVTEGRHHLVKRLCLAIGHPVRRLKRTGFGPLLLKDLPSGSVRTLLMSEYKRLQQHLSPSESDEKDHRRKIDAPIDHPSPSWHGRRYSKTQRRSSGTGHQRTP